MKPVDKYGLKKKFKLLKKEKFSGAKEDFDEFGSVKGKKMSEEEKLDLLPKEYAKELEKKKKRSRAKE